MPRSNWKGETRYEWRGRYGARRLVRALGKCEDCGAKAIDRHHKDGDTHNNVVANIACLCRRCHMRADGRLSRGLPHYVAPIRQCSACGRDTKPTWRGMCRQCYDAKRRAACAEWHEGGAK